MIVTAARWASPCLAEGKEGQLVPQMGIDWVSMSSVRRMGCPSFCCHRWHVEVCCHFLAAFVDLENLLVTDSLIVTLSEFFSKRLIDRGPKQCRHLPRLQIQRSKGVLTF